GIENGNVPFHNCGQLGVWIDGKKFRFVLLAFACVDGNRFVRSPRFFQKQRDFGGVWRSAVVKFQHICLLRIISSSSVKLIYVEFCEIPQAITTKSEHADHWTKILRTG